jgi:hypothetical protein
MNTSTSRPEVRVESDTADHYRVRLVSRGGFSEDELVGLFMSVYEHVNPAAPLSNLPPSAKATASFGSLYEEGPVLFNVAAVDAQTGRSSERVAGLKVSAKHLEATLQQLRSLGFTVLS